MGGRRAALQGSGASGAVAQLPTGLSLCSHPSPGLSTRVSRSRTPRTLVRHRFWENGADSRQGKAAAHRPPRTSLPTLNMAASPASKMAAAALRGARAIETCGRPLCAPARRPLYGSGEPSASLWQRRPPGPERARAAGGCPWLPTASSEPWGRAATGRWAWCGTGRTASRYGGAGAGHGRCRLRLRPGAGAEVRPQPHSWACASGCSCCLPCLWRLLLKVWRRLFFFF